MTAAWRQTHERVSEDEQQPRAAGGRRQVRESSTRNFCDTDLVQENGRFQTQSYSAQLSHRIEPEASVSHEPYECNCKSLLQERSAAFKTSDAELEAIIRSMTCQMEQLFMKAFSDRRFDSHLQTNRQDICRQLLMKLPQALVALVWGKHAEDERLTLRRLMQSVDEGSGKGSVDMSMFVQSIFFSFLTVEVFEKRAEVLTFLRVPTQETNPDIQAFHADLEAQGSFRNAIDKAKRLLTEGTDPFEVNIQLVKWRQFQRRRLDNVEAADKIGQMATELSNRFGKAIACLSLPGRSNGLAKTQLDKDLVPLIVKAIRLACDLELSSFRYSFFRFGTGEHFDKAYMATYLQSKNTPAVRLNKVRFAKTPCIVVRRPNGTNGLSKNESEIEDKEYLKGVVVIEAEVVCFTGGARA